MTDNKVIYSMVGVGKIVPPNRTILRDIYLSYFYGAKIGVLGLNGSGKSSLLKIMAGVDKEFLGETVLSPGYTIGYLEQEPLVDESRTVREVVEEGVQEIFAVQAIPARFPTILDWTDERVKTSYALPDEALKEVKR